MRTLAIDLGTRRVGLAISDDGGRFANPLEVLEVSSPQAALAQVMRVIQREQPLRLVLGLPLNMDDSVGPAAQQTIVWGRQLASQAALPVILIDERLSSFQATQQLIDRKRRGEKITRQRQKQRLDAIAAASFLQSFLDGQLLPYQPPG